MCAMDRRERALIRQLHFPNDLRENISLLKYPVCGNDSNLLIVFYVQIMPDDFVMQLHRF